MISGGIWLRSAPTMAVVPRNTRTNVPHSSSRYLCHSFCMPATSEGDDQTASDSNRLSEVAAEILRLGDRAEERRRGRVADRDGECGGCVVGPRNLIEPENRLHHPPHLVLVGAAVAADRLLHAGRRV